MITMENTKIEWATHSFSPWIGCSKVHVGCANCYAEAMAGRLGVRWGTDGIRRRTAESTWRQVERWNKKAAPGICTCPGITKRYTSHNWPCPAVVVRPRVFPSLCDPFEDYRTAIWDAQGVTSMDDVRRDFFSLIDRCQNLDFLLLTKRPKHIRRMWLNLALPIPATGFSRRENVWLLYSASDQQTMEAGLPHLLACRDLVPVLGLSLEPLVGPVDLFPKCPPEFQPWLDHDRINWVIVGGESGPKARPCDVSWIRSVVEQCRAAGVPCFVKQLGAKPLFPPGHPSCVIRDSKGGDQSEWPDDLRVREFPRT